MAVDLNQLWELHNDVANINRRLTLMLNKKNIPKLEQLITNALYGMADWQGYLHKIQKNLKKGENIVDKQE